MSAEEFPIADPAGMLLRRLRKNTDDHDAFNRISNGQAVGVGDCGDSIEVSLRVEEGVIVAVGVMPRGCVYTRLCAVALSELARGRTPDQALELEPEDVVNALGTLPQDHTHCARLALNTLGEAIADYYAKISRRNHGGQP